MDADGDWRDGLIKKRRDTRIDGNQMKPIFFYFGPLQPPNRDVSERVRGVSDCVGFRRLFLARPLFCPRENKVRSLNPHRAR